MDKREGAAAGKARPPRCKLLFCIVNLGDAEKLKETVEENTASLTFLFSGMGTAHSAVLDYLGVGQTEKSVLVSLFPESDEERVLKAIREKISFYRGRGISFTAPLSGISEITAKGLLAAATEKGQSGRKLMKDEDRKYDLIVASLTANFTDAAMEAARAAGAAGGTVLRARSMENAKAEQFIGITLLNERELLLILTRRERKLAIMQALSEKVGLKTEAGGVIFSLPVDNTAGIIGEEAAEKDKGEENA